ncbi:MAG: hypothetical protein ABJD68_06215 [Nakamurella sp.]
MNINWGALGLVAVTTLVAAIAVVGIFSLGIVALTSGVNRGAAGPHTAARVAGYACIGVSGMLVLYGLYLIIPQFH